MVLQIWEALQIGRLKIYEIGMEVYEIGMQLLHAKQPLVQDQAGISV